MYGVVVHGGAGGTSHERENGCRRASQRAMRILRGGESALDTVVEAVRWMEDSGFFNAGVGSILRIDETIEMEAVIATSEGLQRTVEVTSGMQNPILVAKELMSTDLRRISGVGAFQFAMERELKPHPGPTKEAQQRLHELREEVKRILATGEDLPGWTTEELRRFADCNSHAGVLSAVDTVGAVALDRKGVFALAASTGGSGLMRRGRGGDVPVREAGFQIGPEGAVVATGIGEAIIDLRGSNQVYQRILMGSHPQQACEQAVALFPGDVPVGFIAITRKGIGVASNYPMPIHSILGEEE